MAHHGHATTMDTLGAFGLLGWFVLMWAAVVVLILAERRGVHPAVHAGAGAVVVIGLAGQLIHMWEHVWQAGQWVAHPNSPARMTPWGTGLAAGFGGVDRSRPVLGMEILHFVGNMIFLVGLLGVLVMTRQARSVKAQRTARIGSWLQGAHCVEHLALMGTVWLGANRPIGVSTWFGQMDPGPGLWTYRIWWHFWANAIPTWYFLLAAWQLWSERETVAASRRTVRSPGRLPSALPA